MKNIERYTVNHKLNIRHAVKSINESGVGFAVVVDGKNKVIGVITDGDFRRAILNGVDLNESVLKITNKTFEYVQSGFSRGEAINLLKSGKIEFLPVLEKSKLIDILREEDIREITSKSFSAKKINLPVIIMAGGKGTRLEPFTKILPKPLIPIGDKSIMEIIMDEYAKYGMTNFYLSLFYKANMIKSYMEYLESDYKIEYIHELKPLGTAGALKYLEGKLNTPFFVSNCDIIIKENYNKIFGFHKNGNFMLTMVTAMRHVSIPYGVCDLHKNGTLKKINEKPELDFLINSGMYILDPKALEYIPKDTLFDFTDLIRCITDRNLKVGVYPVTEDAYIDIGQWAEYKKAVSILQV
ncbi:MAG: hypothetical protein A2103_04180 [Gammaproteobacteria bacterium GWF2_41_13]|nr:MAG: hypothetical protein A2103_04180 [Gammaproteobacteria bacterium GWF2_41_13]